MLSHFLPVFAYNIKEFLYTKVIFSYFIILTIFLNNVTEHKKKVIFLNYKLIIFEKKIYFQRFLLEKYNQQHFVEKKLVYFAYAEFLKVWVLKNKKRERNED